MASSDNKSPDSEHKSPESSLSTDNVSTLSTPGSLRTAQPVMIGLVVRRQPPPHVFFRSMVWRRFRVRLFKIQFSQPRTGWADAEFVLTLQENATCIRRLFVYWNCGLHPLTILWWRLYTYKSQCSSFAGFTPVVNMSIASGLENSLRISLSEYARQWANPFSLVWLDRISSAKFAVFRRSWVELA